MQQKFDPSRLAFSPGDATKMTLETLEYIHKHKDRLLTVGIPDIDRSFVPLMAPDICFVIGSPSNGKTSLLSWWARTRGQWLKLHGITNRVPVYISWETAIERLHMFHIAASKHIPVDTMSRGIMNEQQWIDVIEYAGSYSEITNLWYIGRSLAQAHDKPGEVPPLEVRYIAGALKSITGKGYEIDSIFGDYLQEIPVWPKPENRVLGITQTASQLKDLGFQFGCPVVMGTQASQDVVDTTWKIPGKEDSEWGNVGKIADSMLAVMRPCVYWPEGEVMFDGVVVEGENQLLVKCVKQKLGSQNWYEWVYLNPAINDIKQMAKREII